jgi:hypothetical protein
MRELRALPRARRRSSRAVTIVVRLKQKSPAPPNLTRSEKKAADIDVWVKDHIAELREADKVKTSRLKALREARQAESSEPKTSAAEPASRKSPQQAKRMRRIWVSGPESRAEGKLSNS